VHVRKSGIPVAVDARVRMDHAGRRRLIRMWAAASVLVLVGVAGCGGSGSSSSRATPGSSPATSAPSPATVRGCLRNAGFKVTKTDFPGALQVFAANGSAVVRPEASPDKAKQVLAKLGGSNPFPQPGGSPSFTNFLTASTAVSGLTGLGRSDVSKIKNCSH
jgi:hypothetical protein